MTQISQMDWRMGDPQISRMGRRQVWLPGCLLLLVVLLVSVRLTGATVEVLVGPGAAGAAGEVVLKNPFGLLRDAKGDLWWCEYDGQVIRRMDGAGKVTLVAGCGDAGYSGDGGMAIAARMNQPHEIRLDRRGNLFFTDMKNHAIRRVDARTGIITTVAGTGQAGYTGDGGPASAATLRQPHSLQFDAKGDLFICDTGNHVVRKLETESGRITTIAGTGKAGPTPDDSNLAGVALNGPRAIEFDGEGGLWLATREGNQLFRLDLAAGRIRRVAGAGPKGPKGDGGPAGEAWLTGPKGLSLDPVGGSKPKGVMLVDTESHTLRRVDLERGIIERVLGTGAKGATFDPDPLKCPLARPHGVWTDPAGGWLVGDSENHRLLRLR